MINFVFAGAFWDSANILLFLITTFIIVMLLLKTVTPFFQNLRLARLQANTKALKLTIAAPAVYLFLAVLLNLNPGGLAQSFILLVTTLVLYYVEAHVYRQLKANTPRRTRRRR